MTGMTVELTDAGRIEVEQGYRIAYRVFGTGRRTLLGAARRAGVVQAAT